MPKSKSKGVYIYSGNSTILVLDNRRWGAGSTSTSFPPVPRSSLDVVSRGRKSALPFVRSQRMAYAPSDRDEPSKLGSYCQHPYCGLGLIKGTVRSGDHSIQFKALGAGDLVYASVLLLKKKNPIIAQSIVNVYSRACNQFHAEQRLVGSLVSAYPPSGIRAQVNRPQETSVNSSGIAVGLWLTFRRSRAKLGRRNWNSAEAS